MASVSVSRRPASPRWTRHVPGFFARLLGLLAVLCAAAAISAALSVRSQPLRGFIDVVLVPAPANLGYAMFCAVLSAAVSRRKRIALVALFSYFGLQIAFDLGLLTAVVWTGQGFIGVHRSPWWVPGASTANLVLSLVALSVLWLSRDRFTARVQHASIRKALLVFAGTAVVVTAAGWALLLAAPGRLEEVPRLVYVVQHVLGGVFTLEGTRAGHDAPGWVNLLLGLGGAIAILLALATLLRSQRQTAYMSADDEQRVRELLAAHGDRDSLGYFATRRDKSVVFSPSGKAAVTYRVVNGVSLASGDPVGDVEAWPAAITAWLEHNREYAWTPAVMGASEAGATCYARAGLRTLELGDEAIIEVSGFTLDGHEMRPVRQAVNRVSRAGYSVRIRRHCEIGAPEMARVIGLAAAWRDTETERGFSMALGRLGDPADPRCVMVEALDRDGREAALLSFVPWGRDGLSLDLMRRDRDSDNGLVEFMVSELARAAPRFEVTRVSLNFAAFRAVFDEGARIGAGPVLRAHRGLLLFFSRWFQLESIYRSNVKYRPTWVPRFVCFEDRRDLAAVAFASGVAEGFVHVPSLWTLLRRGQRAPAAPATGGTVNDVAPAAATGPRPSFAPSSAGEQERVRGGKADALGDRAYPPHVLRTHSCAEVRRDHAGLGPDARSGRIVSVAGRVMLVRGHGGVTFATLRDWTGDLQVMLDAAGTGRSALEEWNALVDRGDVVSVTGEVVATRRCELSVHVTAWTMAAKCLRPLPDKRNGLADPEARVRQRYLALIVDADARDMLRARGRVLHAVREALVENDFLEVETPVLQRTRGGANARPFVTRINAYDMSLVLRIAPELYLKRLAVGGAERIFELGRSFRNEGVDGSHNPEFTMLEAYRAYADYTDMRHLTQELIVRAATAAHGKPVARRPGGDVDLSGDWPVRTVYDAVAAALGEPLDPDTPTPTLTDWARRTGVPLEPAWNRGQIVLECYERLVEHRTDRPTFYTDFPVEVCPLTRAHRVDARLAERWDLVAFGMEVATAYSELVDPREQRSRFTEQSLLAAAGDAEAMDLDEDFLLALDYAMPPTGGLGLGIDRLIMALTGRSIRQTVSFPLIRDR
jgi:lysyl-tRNA synthetase, class II